MKKILFCILLLFISFDVYAEVDYTSINRDDIKNKASIKNIDYNIYVSAEIFFNIDEKQSEIIDNVDAIYDSSEDAIIISLKRSEINKAIKSDYKTIFEDIRINIDLYNNKKDMYFLINDEKINDQYNVKFISKDNNYFEVGSLYFSLFSNKTQLNELKPLIFTDNKDYDKVFSEFNNGKTYYKKSEMTNAKFIGGSKIYFQIIEDDQKNYNQVSTIIKNNKEIKNIESITNNFYVNAEDTFYSWSLFDSNGNTKNINNPTKIEFNITPANEITDLFKDYINTKVYSLRTDYKNYFNGFAKISFMMKDKFADISVFKLFQYDSKTKKLVDYDDYVVKSSEGYVNIFIKSGGLFMLTIKDIETNPGALARENFSIKDFPQPINFYIIFSYLIFVILIINLLFKIIKNKKIKKRNNKY